MICVYPTDASDFTGNGNAVLVPLKAKVRMVAGGECSFTMEHPLDPWGKWKYLVREAIVKLPVPKETIPAASVGYDTDIYKTTAKADLREGPSEPTTINYQQWVAGNTYSVGSKVTYNNHNFVSAGKRRQKKAGLISGIIKKPPLTSHTVSVM